MDTSTRDMFDGHLEQVLRELPPRVHELLRDVPLIVEDYPSRELRRSLKLRRRDSLCGLYTGVPLGHRSIEQLPVPSDAIYLFREGILAAARRWKAVVDPARLKREIRITILHELGHHHGMGEHELEELGY
jgi:predicted Zn-dependent protease with MMP-like domain